MDIKLNKFIISTSMFLLLSAHSNANTLNIFVSGGPNYSALHNELLVQINDTVTNAYQPRKKTNWQGFWAVGANHTFANKWFSFYQLSLGAAGYFFHLGDVKGIAFPFINAGIFDTLNYSFQAKSAAVLAEARITYSHYKLKPFAMIGLGTSWNHFYNYYEVPTVPELSAAPAVHFSNHTKQNFSYELGAGVQYLLWNDNTRHIQYTASAGYQYFNLGKGSLGSFQSQASPDRLKVKSLFTQGIVFSLAVSI